MDDLGGKNPPFSGKHPYRNFLRRLAAPRAVDPLDGRSFPGAKNFGPKKGEKKRHGNQTLQ